MSNKYHSLSLLTIVRSTETVTKTVINIQNDIQNRKAYDVRGYSLRKNDHNDKFVLTLRDPDAS
jgi:hypothetical protein